MDVAVLPDLERERVEAERLELPAQVEELAVGDALHPLRRRARRGISSSSASSSLGRRVARARVSRPSTTRRRVRRNRSAMLPKRRRYGSFGIAPLELQVGARRGRSAIALEPLVERVSPRSGGSAVATVSISAASATCLVGRGARGRPRWPPPRASCAAVTLRMAVAVGADPGAPAQERIDDGGRVPVRPQSRRRARRGRPSAERARRGRGRAAASPRTATRRRRRSACAPRRAARVARRGARAVRHRSEISSRSRRRIVGVLGRREPRVVEPVEQPEARRRRDEQRAPAGLGRVGGQDEADRETSTSASACARVVLAAPERGRPHRPSSSTRRPACPLRAPLTQPPDALLLLGQVREVEVEAEGADEVLDAVVRSSASRMRAQLASLVARPCRCADVDRQAPDALDEAQQRPRPPARR